MSVVVTVHLLGGPVLVSLHRLGYNTLKETICAEFPLLVGSLPNFSEQILRMSYKEGKKAKTKKNTTINPRTKPEDFPVLCLEWLEISICFIINVNIYKSGKELSTKRSNLLFNATYFSNAAVSAFVRQCNTELEVYAKGKSMDTACCDKNGIMFKEEHLLKPLQNQKDYFLVQDQSCYSHASIAQLLSKINFPDAVMERVEQHGTMRKSNEKTKYLDAFADALPDVTPLDAAVKRARTELNEEKWNLRVDACVDNLALLNRHVASAAVHSESARRLLINEVVKQVIAYTGGSFYVEELQNSAKGTEDKFLGWGPLDYTISTDVVLDVVVDENENDSENENEDAAGASQSQGAAHRSVRTSAEEELDAEDEDEGENSDQHGGVQKLAGGSADSPSPAPMAVVQETIEEAKAALDDGGLAQVGAQSHDRLEATPATDRVALLLCTGHKWRHFVLQRGAGTDKPMLTYFGEASMHILRSTVSTTAAPRCKNKRRPSCPHGDEYTVDRGEIENVMLSLLCSVGRKLHLAEAGPSAPLLPRPTVMPTVPPATAQGTASAAAAGAQGLDEALVGAYFTSKA